MKVTALIENKAGEGLAGEHGLANIVEEVSKTFGGREVAAAFGGLHLMGLRGTNSMSGKPEDIKCLARRLIDLNVKDIYTGHCTGDPAFRIMKEELGERLHYFSTGATVEL